MSFQFSNLTSNSSKTMQFKLCNACEKSYLRTSEYFNLCAKNKDGITSSCRECNRKIKAQSRAKLKDTKPPCKAPNCAKLSREAGYCTKHYQQMKAHGKVFERTAGDPNFIEFTEECLLLHIYNGHKGTEKDQILKAKIMIDHDCLDLVQGNYWMLQKQVDKLYEKVVMHNGRSLRKKGFRKAVLLEKLILGIENETHLHVIMKNGNPFDLRRENLTILNKSERGIRARKNENFDNKYKGVYFAKREQKWQAYIGFHNRRISGGYFDTEEEAFKKRQELELEYFGEVIQNA